MESIKECTPVIMLSDYLRAQFGEKVYKLSLSAGCTCPNRDGTLGYTGCDFCSAGGSGDFAAPFLPLDEQIQRAKARIAQKTKARRYIAYFQSFTNTYGDIPRLQALYADALSRDEIVLLSLGTRPDCLGDEAMAMLRFLQARYPEKPIWIELGLQTIHASTARRFHRGYDLPVFEDAYARLHDAGIPVIVHVIFGLPGESTEQMLDTVRYLAALRPVLDGVKLQMLHVLKHTPLGDAYERDPFPLLDLPTYAQLIAQSVAILPEQTVIHRLTGDGPGKLLLAPDWTRNKKRVLHTIQQAIANHIN